MACIAPLIAAEKYPSKPIARVGKLRVLAVTTAKRSALLPGVPPIAETLKGFDMTSWNGLFAPAGTPQAIVARLTQEALATLAQADVKDRLAALGFEVDPPGYGCVRPLRARAAQHLGKLILAAKIQPE